MDKASYRKTSPSYKNPKNIYNENLLHIVLKTEIHTIHCITAKEYIHKHIQQIFTLVDPTVKLKYVEELEVFFIVDSSKCLVLKNCF